MLPDLPVIVVVYNTAIGLHVFLQVYTSYGLFLTCSRKQASQNYLMGENNSMGISLGSAFIKKPSPHTKNNNEDKHTHTNKQNHTQKTPPKLKNDNDIFLRNSQTHSRTQDDQNL